MTGAQKPFRIVQLSDLHLTAKDDASRSEPKLFGALKGMNEAFRKLVHSQPVRSADLLLVTGDVTDRGDLESWKVFWDAVRDAGIRDVQVVPGNHDVCCLGVRRPPDAQQRKDDLARAVKGIGFGGTKNGAFPWLARPEERIAIIGLNSNNLGNISALDNAIGRLHLYQLSGLADMLHKVRDVPVKIIALHHSPNIPSQEVELKRGLKPFGPVDRRLHQLDPAGRTGLHLLSQTHRVRLIVHGHLHRPEVRRVGAVRIVGAPASTEPVTGQGRRVYPLFEYTITGKKPLVRARLVLVDA